MTELSLGAGFPRHTYEDWRALAEATLEGADFERRLVTHTYDGIAIEPLYAAGHAAAVSGPVAGGTQWAVSQAVSHRDPKRAAALVREEIEGGATSIVLRVASSERPDGIAIDGMGDLETVLGALDTGSHGVRLDAGSRGLGMAALLAAHLGRHGISGARCALGIDPYAGLTDGVSDAGHPDAIIAAASRALDAGATGTVFTVDAHRLHAAGASEAQELAGALAMGVHLLRSLEKADIEPHAASRSISFVFAADADIFLTIAKLRAWTLVWARVLEACGVEGVPARPSAATASRMLTTRDPAVNMLRATAAVFAAAAGGAGEITVAPYTDALGQPDGLARRLARNTQLILREESGIARVADPAAGSWYVDTITSELAQRAWQAFQAVEAMGGIVAAFEAGHMQSTIGSVTARRAHDIATRKVALTGVSEFADLAEKPASIEAPAAGTYTAPATRAVTDWSGALETASSGAIPCVEAPAPAAVALPRVSLAEPFEALRTLSDRTLAATGARPRVFIATVGPLSDYTARASWLGNVFEAGGIEVVLGEVPAFATSGAAIACLCGADAAYEEHAADMTAALKGAGARHIYLAGRGGDALAGAGIDTFVHVGVDIVALLEAAHRHCAANTGS